MLTWRSNLTRNRISKRNTVNLKTRVGDTSESQWGGRREEESSGEGMTSCFGREEKMAPSVPSVPSVSSFTDDFSAACCYQSMITRSLFMSRILFTRLVKVMEKILSFKHFYSLLIHFLSIFFIKTWSRPIFDLNFRHGVHLIRNLPKARLEPNSKTSLNTKFQEIMSHEPWGIGVSNIITRSQKWHKKAKK